MELCVKHNTYCQFDEKGHIICIKCEQEKEEEEEPKAKMFSDVLKELKGEKEYESFLRCCLYYLDGRLEKDEYNSNPKIGEESIGRMIDVAYHLTKTGNFRSYDETMDWRKRNEKDC